MGLAPRESGRARTTGGREGASALVANGSAPTDSEMTAVYKTGVSGTLPDPGQNRGKTRAFPSQNRSQNRLSQNDYGESSFGTYPPGGGVVFCSNRPYAARSPPERGTRSSIIITSVATSLEAQERSTHRGLVNPRTEADLLRERVRGPREAGECDTEGLSLRSL